MITTRTSVITEGRPCTYVCNKKDARLAAPDAHYVMCALYVIFCQAVATCGMCKRLRMNFAPEVDDYPDSPIKYILRGWAQKREFTLHNPGTWQTP